MRTSRVSRPLTGRFTVMRLAAAKLPVTSEVIDKKTPPRVGYESVEQTNDGPRVITRGELEVLETAAAAAAAVKLPQETPAL